MDFLTQDEVLDVLQIAKQHSTRDWFMILMAYMHGMRANEIVNLRTGDIKDGSITIVRAKGSKVTVQPLEKHSKTILNERDAYELYMKQRPRDWGDALFQSAHGGPITTRQFYNIVRRYTRWAGVGDSKCHPHVLKHSLANHLVRHGLDVSKVQVRLGHASITSTMKYIALNDAEVAVETRSAMLRMY